MENFAYYDLSSSTVQWSMTNGPEATACVEIKQQRIPQHTRRIKWVYLFFNRKVSQVHFIHICPRNVSWKKKKSPRYRCSNGQNAENVLCLMVLDLISSSSTGIIIPKSSFASFIFNSATNCSGKGIKGLPHMGYQIWKEGREFHGIKTRYQGEPPPAPSGRGGRILGVQLPSSFSFRMHPWMVLLSDLISWKIAYLLLLHTIQQWK